MASGNVIPTRDELLDELASMIEQPQIPPNAVTVKMLAEKSGRNDKACREFLNRKVRDGSMGVVQVRITKWYYVLSETLTP